MRPRIDFMGFELQAAIEQSKQVTDDYGNWRLGHACYLTLRNQVYIMELLKEMANSIRQIEEKEKK